MPLNEFSFNLLHQLAREIDGNLPDLLTKCLTIASNSEIMEFKTWISNELGGYSAGADLPDYRIIHNTLPTESQADRPEPPTTRNVPRSNSIGHLQIRTPIREICSQLDAANKANASTSMFSTESESALSNQSPQEFQQSPGSVLGHSELSGVIESARAELSQWIERLLDGDCTGCSNNTYNDDTRPTPEENIQVSCVPTSSCTTQHLNQDDEATVALKRSTIDFPVPEPQHSTKAMKLLFVDDVHFVLESYHRSIRPKLKEGWDAFYADSAARALEVLAEQRIDVVISDMRMPEMSGAQLLNEVMVRYPRTARIILSGYADQDLIRECLGSAHQFLAKPINFSELFKTINDIGEAGKHAEAEWLDRLLERLNFLPCLPQTCHQLETLLTSDDATTTQIGNVVALDPAMTTQVLRLVNSPLLGLRRSVANPIEAITYLGVDNLRSLLLSHEIIRQFDPSHIAWFRLDWMVAHSQRVALGAKAIARLEGAPKVTQDQAFSAGLLHDLGILVLADNFPIEYRSIYMAAEERGAGLREAEQNGFRAAHPGIAGHLLNLWGLPPEIVQAVTFHHAPSLTQGGCFTPLVAVHIAEALDAAPAEGSHLDEAFLAQIPLNYAIDDWRLAFEEACKMRPHS